MGGCGNNLASGVVVAGVEDDGNNREMSCNDLCEEAPLLMCGLWKIFMWEKIWLDDDGKDYTKNIAGFWGFLMSQKRKMWSERERKKGFFGGIMSLECFFRRLGIGICGGWLSLRASVVERKFCRKLCLFGQEE